MSVEIIKLGQPRVRRVTLKPGKYATEGAWCIVNAPVVVDCHEKFDWLYESLQRGDHEYPEPFWKLVRYDFDTAQPMAKDPEPVSATELRLPWWRRWFGPKIPLARVVKR